MKTKLPSIVLILLSSWLSTKTFAQRDAGGYSEGKDTVYKQTITNFPNSFNISTTIKYDVPEKGKVILQLYNATGHQITTLLQNELSPGNYTIEYNASAIPAGIYICKYSMITDQKTSVIVRKFSVIK